MEEGRQVFALLPGIGCNEDRNDSAFRVLVRYPSLLHLTDEAVQVRMALVESGLITRRALIVQEALEEETVVRYR